MHPTSQENRAEVYILHWHLGQFTVDAKALGGFILDITGRADRQLNINGVRVALERIETVMFQAEG